jgi:hypothetical protein
MARVLKDGAPCPFMGGDAARAEALLGMGSQPALGPRRSAGSLV